MFYVSVDRASDYLGRDVKIWHYVCYSPVFPFNEVHFCLFFPAILLGAHKFRIAIGNGLLYMPF